MLLHSWPDARGPDSVGLSEAQVSVFFQSLLDNVAAEPGEESSQAELSGERRRADLSSGRICPALGMFGRSETQATVEGHSWAFSTSQPASLSSPSLLVSREPFLALPPALSSAVTPSRKACWSPQQLIPRGDQLSPFPVTAYHDGSLPSSVRRFICFCVFSVLVFWFFLSLFLPSFLFFLLFYPLTRL